MTAKITSIDNATIKNPTLQTSNVNNTYTLSLPTKAGTVALTSDITSATSSLATKAELNTVSSNVSGLENRVDGMLPAQVFDTVADMDAWLANPANTENLPVGTNLYIRALDVPDYWWDGTSAQELETSKVNITDAATKTGTETLTNKTITDPILKDSSTSYTLKVPTLSENTTIATAKDLTGYASTNHTHSQYLTSHQDLSNYATLTGTETLTNKSLTEPTFTSGTFKHITSTITYNHSLPLNSSTLVDLTATQTLRNKTLDSTTITGSQTRLVGNILISDNGTDMIYIDDTVGDNTNTIRLITQYATQALYNKTLHTPILKDASTSYTLRVPTLSENTTIATAKDLTGYATTSHNHDSVYAPITHTHSQYLTEHQSLASCVKTTGNETIAGVKTFSSAPKLSSNTITNSSGKTITLPSAAGTLATTSHNHDSVYAPITHTHSQYLTEHQSLDGCVKISGDQTVGGTKTFSVAPKLGSNTILCSNGNTITFPVNTATLATTRLPETLKNKILDSTNDINDITPGSASALMKAIINVIYPVGIVCFFYSTDKPNDKFPGTTWEILSTGKYVQTRAQAAASSTGGSSTSGSTTVKLTDIPSHNHTATSTFTGTQASGSVQSRRASAANNISNYGTNSNVSFTVTEQTGDSWKSATSTTSKTHNTDVLTWTYTPKGSVSTTTGDAGGGGGHSHSINPPYITLNAWRQTA